MGANQTLLSNDEIAVALGLPKDVLTAVATKEGDDFVKATNEVLNAVNKIAYQKAEKMNFSDPFKKYDGKPITYGSTIENLWIEPPKGYKYDPNATDPFTKAKVTNKALYATINYDMQYQTTIQRDLIKRAVLNEGGLMELIDYISSSVATQTEIDTYEATIRMLNNADLFATGIEDLDISKLADAKAKAKASARKIKDVITDFALPCRDNNKLKVMNVCPKEHALLVIKQELLNDIDFDFLEGVYNLSKVELTDKIIPVRDFRVVSNDETPTATRVGEDIAFMIIDERGFDNHVALRDGGSIYNPKGRYFNQFTDLWKIISYKYWFNARAFKLKTA